MPSPLSLRVAECRWRGCTALLSLQHETGLTLRSPASGGRGLVLWRHGFEKLADTWDDDSAVVRMTFSSGETVVSGNGVGKVALPDMVVIVPAWLEFLFLVSHSTVSTLPGFWWGGRWF